jgi:uncharacterized membrane protein
VCPQCLVHAAVGIRCQDCGQATRLPTYNVSASYVLRAILAGLAVGLVGGLVLGLIVRPLLFGFLYLAAMAGYGYLMSEAIGLATGRKRGRRLQFVAGASVVVASAVSVVLSLAFIGGSPVFDLLGAALAIYVAVIRLR